MLLRTGIALGLARDALMAEAAVGEDDLEDRDAYLPFARQVALGDAIARRRLGVNIGIAALQRMSPASLGVLGDVVVHSASLRDALDAFIRFQRLLTDGVRWTVTRGAALSIALDVDPAYERLGHPVEALLGLWVLLGRKLTATSWLPLDVGFRHGPQGDPAEVERFFGAGVRFRADANELRMPLAALDLPLVTASAALEAPMHRVAELRLAKVDGGGSHAERLREMMFASLPQGVTGRAELARRMGLSVRPLNRRLLEESTTFRDVLDGARRDLATSWLGDGRHAVYEVAYLLGYSDPSTFHRAFRRWTGASPQAWARAHTS